MEEIKRSIYSIPHKRYTVDDLIVGEGNRTKFLIPSEISEIGESYFVTRQSVSKKLKELGYTTQEYFDVFILNLKSPDDRPKCINCGKEVPYGRSTSVVGGHHSLFKSATEVIPARFCSNHACSTLYVESHPEEYEYYHKSKKEFYESGGTTGYILRNPDKYPDAIKFWKEGGALGYMHKHPELYPNFKGGPGFSKSERGYYKSERFGDLRYDSSYECELLDKLDHNENVISLVVQPFSIPYYWEDGSKHRYIPDMLVGYKDGSFDLIEVKPEHLLEFDRNPLKFEAAIEYCNTLGYNFKIFTENDIFT